MAVAASMTLGLMAGSVHAADPCQPTPTGANPCGFTWRVSVSSTGAPALGTHLDSALSGDGDVVAFSSDSADLVAGDTNSTWDVFVHHRPSGVTERVSVASDGSEANSYSDSAAFSADGRYVTFRSNASNLVPGDTNGIGDLFLHDRQTGHTERISVASDGGETPHGAHLESSISADGRYVAFVSSGLVPGDTNGEWDVHVRDRLLGTTTRVSVASDGSQANGGSSQPSISADGRYVAFPSYASNLVPGDTNGTYDVFVHDRATATTTRVSVAADGSQADNYSFHPSISADGQLLAFASEASNLVSGDTNAVPDIFVRRLDDPALTLVSVSVDGDPANGYSQNPALAADGRSVAFVSRASDLVPIDPNDRDDVFLHRLDTGVTTLASAGLAGTPVLMGGGIAGTPIGISFDGRHVAFVSDAWSLTADDLNLASHDVFVRDEEWLTHLP